MVRLVTRARSFAEGESREGAAAGSARQKGARRGAAAVRLLLAPAAVLAGALAGLVYVVLLPVCGLASIAEAIARSCGRFLRRAVALRENPGPTREADRAQ